MIRAIAQRKREPEQGTIGKKCLIQLEAQAPKVHFGKSVATTSFLNDIKGAIQIHHAKDDTVVDIRYSRNLMSYLDKTSIPHELFEYDYGGHNIIDSSFSIAMQRTVEFYKNI